MRVPATAALRRSGSFGEHSGSTGFFRFRAPATKTLVEKSFSGCSRGPANLASTTYKTDWLSLTEQVNLEARTCRRVLSLATS